MKNSPSKKKRFNYNSKKIALSGILLAFALIISLVENMLPPLIPALPYAKLGLCNIVLLACFMLVGVWEGYVVLLLKCLLAAVFAGNLSMMIWSLPSSLVAYTVMVLLYKTKLLSITGLSMAGGMLHNFTQIVVATAVVGKSVFAYLPYMLLAGGLAGFATGIICHFLLAALKQNRKDKFEESGVENAEGFEDFGEQSFDSPKTTEHLDFLAKAEINDADKAEDE